MKKLFSILTIILSISSLIQSQNAKANAPLAGSLVTESKLTALNAKFLTIHKEKDSPFEIYQDLGADELVIRLKNQFDVLRFELRDESGKTMSVKGIQDKNEVHANLHDLSNGRYRLIVDRNKEKIFTEITLNR
ncbi:MAG: hypothetical protein ABI761_07110 [Saprospiraceae bacterium]